VLATDWLGFEAGVGLVENRWWSRQSQLRRSLTKVQIGALRKELRLFQLRGRAMSRRRSAQLPGFCQGVLALRPANPGIFLELFQRTKERAAAAETYAAVDRRV
jgi:hypothetical protein